MSISPTPEPSADAAVRQIGRSGRAHGVRGELSMTLLTPRLERLAPGSWVRLGERWLRVAAARQLPDRWLVTLDGIADRTAAERLAGHDVFAVADQLPDDPDALWVHRIIGARVVDQHGVDRGRCVAVLDNPADDLLELDGGALIPARFASQGADGTVHVDVPDGLFDL